ncbi:hypothetical protein KAI58_02115 [Candidatus Gracilibacteria bacterium]|nr:hypothetical protein [Candidatus Gracilibacteria bacterium]
MKKLLILSVCILLVGCGGIQSKVEEKIEAGGVINLFEEDIDQDWKGLRILKPYQKKNILGQSFEQKDDQNCLWVFLGREKIIESFPISRSVADCLKLPETLYQPNEAIFILKNGELKIREEFKP